MGEAVSDSLLVVATGYRTIYSVVGSYITARLAPDRPMKHALAGGVIGLILGTVGAVVTWNGVGVGHHWYSIALAVLALPAAWVGGRTPDRTISGAAGVVSLRSVSRDTFVSVGSRFRVSRKFRRILPIHLLGHAYRIVDP